jgi:arylsulfatase A-like enzyme
VFDEVLRIPMLLRLPGVLPRGAAVRGPVSLADVAPTVIDLLGLSPLDVAGRSMLPLIRGDDPGEPREALARLVRFREGTIAVPGGEPVPGREAIVEEAFRTGSIKVIRRRRWPFGPPGLPLEATRAIHDLGEQAYRREELVWIDVDRQPDERAASPTTCSLVVSGKSRS